MLIKRRKHSVPSLNTTSTADISFMLLTFFLVTSSMDVDRGLVRLLPPLDKEQTEDATDVPRSNIMQFAITPQSKLTLDGKPVDLGNVRKLVTDFVTKRGARHLIYVDASPDANYDTYFSLENEIVAAYNGVRDAEAQRRFHRAFASCTEQQKNVVRDACPQHISETYNRSEKGGEQ